MTLQDNYAPTKTLGNGVTVVFTAPWDALSVAFIAVYEEDVATGVQTPVTTGITKELGSGGIGVIVTYSVAPTSADYVIIAREAPDTQNSTYKTSSGFQTKVVAADIDKRTAVSQQQGDMLGRSLTLPLATTGVSTVLPAPQADKILGWNSAEDAIENKSQETTSTDYNGTISAGLDANKPASPIKNDMYFATDANIMYRCLINGAWQYDGVFDDLQVVGTLAVAGTTTLNTLELASGATVNEISTDDTLGGDSDSALVTEQSIKAFVENQVELSKVDVANYTTGAYATGTTLIPLDNSIPQITEGDKYLELTYTPKSAAHVLKIDVVINMTGSVNAPLAAALFQDSNANALAVASVQSASNQDHLNTTSFSHYMLAGTTSLTTFSVRAGLDRAGTTRINGDLSGAVYGDKYASSITITEIKS